MLVNARIICVTIIFCYGLIFFIDKSKNINNGSTITRTCAKASRLAGSGEYGKKEKGTSPTGTYWDFDGIIITLGLNSIGIGRSTLEFRRHNGFIRGNPLEGFLEHRIIRIIFYLPSSQIDL